MNEKPMPDGYGQDWCYVTNTPEWVALSHSTREVYRELVRGMDGKNNGFLTFTVEYAKTRGFTKLQRHKGLKELQAAGFILKTAEREGRKPECFAIPWRPFCPSPYLIRKRDRLDGQRSVEEKLRAFWVWANERRKYYRNFTEKFKDDDSLKVNMEYEDIPF